MNASYDVIVIGAGMVGATIACGLAKGGFKVAIVDHQAPPAFVADEVPHIRVSALSYASEQILRNVGAWQYIADKRSCPYRHLAVNELAAQDGVAAKLPDISAWARTRFSASDIGLEYLGHIIENDIIQLALHESFADHDAISLYCPEQVAHYDLATAEKCVELVSGKTLRAPLVIGADGARSAVRSAAQLGQYIEQYEQHAFVATVSYQGQQEDMTWQCFTEHGPIAFLPLSDSGDKHYASLVWYDQASAIEHLKKMDKTELRTHFQRAYPEALPAIVNVHQTASFPVFKSHANNDARAGVVLVGDAAHTINPLAGQGGNLGVMDAAVLIEELSRARVNAQDFATQNVLKAYERKRRHANQSMMSMMDVFYYGFGSQHLPLRVARNLGLGLANRFGFAKNKVMAYATGLSGNVPKLAKPA